MQAKKIAESTTCLSGKQELAQRLKALKSELDLLSDRVESHNQCYELSYSCSSSGFFAIEKVTRRIKLRREIDDIQCQLDRLKPKTMKYR